ncbi:MAG TPA: hypothetical protein ACFYEF_06435 [Candidatus Wunengus sp. YC63]|uniref:hypothetical protein n=1 Tax=unclassified Candidatus Wunengus TaxID=3367695 RepID=UPI0040256FF4
MRKTFETTDCTDDTDKKTNHLWNLLTQNMFMKKDPRTHAIICAAMEVHNIVGTGHILVPKLLLGNEGVLKALL